jgi:molybdopterin converting factor subunit 1
MKVRVLLFARLREMAGGGTLEMEVPEGTTMGQLWGLLQSRTPSLQAFTSLPLMALNLEYAGPETLLTKDDEIAFLPPVSGG